jgi:hypothetical protein
MSEDRRIKAAAPVLWQSLLDMLRQVRDEYNLDNPHTIAVVQMPPEVTIQNMKTGESISLRFDSQNSLIHYTGTPGSGYIEFGIDPKDGTSVKFRDSKQAESQPLQFVDEVATEFLHRLVKDA